MPKTHAAFTIRRIVRPIVGAVLLALAVCLCLVACKAQPTYTYGDWTVTRQPTDTTEGTATRLRSDGMEQSATLPVLGTAGFYTLSTTPATCLRAGEAVYTCDYGSIRVELSALGHEPGEAERTEVVPATCTEDGHYRNVVRCTRCAAVLSGEVIALPALQHDYVFDSFEWESYSSARAKCVCSRDPQHVTYMLATVTNYLAAAPTCTERGDRTYCAAYEDNVGYRHYYIPATGHKTEAVAAVAADCTTAGNYAYWRCTKCQGCFADEAGTQAVESVVQPALGHVPEDAPVVDYLAPTCVAAGHRTQVLYCAVCHAELQRSHEEYAVDASAHDYVYDGIAPHGDGFAGQYHCTHDASHMRYEAAEVLDTEVLSSADYNEGGRTRYVVRYGNDQEVIIVTSPKLVAPYDGIIYHSGATIEGAGTFGRIANGQVAVVSQHILLCISEDGTGIGSQAPLDGEIVIRMVDAATGQVSVRLNDVYHLGYVDMATGTIVRAATGDDLSDVVLYLPYFDMTAEDIAGTAWDAGMVFAFVAEGAVRNVLLYDGRAYFDVSLFDPGGEALNAEDVADVQCCIVKDAAGNVIATLCPTDSSMVAADGKQGIYSRGNGRLTVYGNGVLTLEDDAVWAEPTQCTYVIDGDVLAVYDLGHTVYLEIVVDGTAYTLEMPMVTIGFDANGFEPVEAFASAVQRNKNISYTLPIYTSSTQTFLGWYLAGDADTLYTAIQPTQSVTYIAKWQLTGDPYEIVLGKAYDADVADYRFEEVEAGVYTSNNKGRPETTAYFAVHFFVAGTFSVDYSGSCEESDGLSYALNGKVRASGDGWASLSETTAGTYTVAVAADDWLYIGYYKDYRDDAGADAFTLSNVRFDFG